jgi:hypothetical protein
VTQGNWRPSLPLDPGHRRILLTWPISQLLPLGSCSHSPTTKAEPSAGRSHGVQPAETGSDQGCRRRKDGRRGEAKSVQTITACEHQLVQYETRQVIAEGHTSNGTAPLTCRRPIEITRTCNTAPTASLRRLWPSASFRSTRSPSARCSGLGRSPRLMEPCRNWSSC